MFRFDIYLCLAIVASVIGEEQHEHPSSGAVDQSTDGDANLFPAKTTNLPIESKLIQYNDENVQLTGYLAYPIDNRTGTRNNIIV